MLDGREPLVLGKLAKEVSKFFGYFVCFRYGRYAIRHRDTAWNIDFQFGCAAILFLGIQTAGVIFCVGANTALLRIVCGLAGSRVIISLFYHYRKHITWLEGMISKYSVEIYMIHGNIVHKLILVPILAAFDCSQVSTMIVLCAVSLATDLGLSLGIAFLEQYLVPLNFVFHPATYLRSRKFYQRL